MSRDSRKIVVDPTLQAAKEMLDAALKAREMVLIVGNCHVFYRGRANSKLTAGERVVIIKEDGALLVHRSTGYDPVNWMPGENVIYHTRILSGREEKQLNRMLHKDNWQPPGCIFHIHAKDDLLEIHAVRQKPPESVKVFFDEIHMVIALSLVDTGEFALYASEEDMQRAVLLEPALLEEGFTPISYEKKVEPGFVDVYGVDKDGSLVVVEIKRKTAGKEAVLQLARYVDAIKSRANRGVRGILVAPKIGKGVQTLLATLGLEFKALNPKKCAETLKRSKNRKLESYFENE